MLNLDDRKWAAACEVGIIGLFIYMLYRLLLFVPIGVAKLWDVVKDMGDYAAKGMAYFIAVFGAPTAIGLGVCISLSFTAVSMAYVFKKEEDKPKFFVIAIALFLNPLFIDFFKDRFHEDQPIMKFLVAACGAVCCLNAMWFWEQAAKSNVSRLGKNFRRTLAVFLFLLPTFCMVGYVAVQAHIAQREFREQLNLANAVGFLLFTSVVGISLSRFYEAP